MPADNEKVIDDPKTKDEANTDETEEVAPVKFNPKKYRAPVFFEARPEDLTIYIGDDNSLEFYPEDYINFYDIEGLEFEKIELLGVKDKCIGCSSSSRKLEFKATDRRQAGTHPFAIRCYDPTTKSSVTKTFNLRIIDTEKEMEKLLDEHKKRPKTKPGFKKEDPLASEDDPLKKGKDKLKEKGVDGKEELKEKRDKLGEKGSLEGDAKSLDPDTEKLDSEAGTLETVDKEGNPRRPRTEEEGSDKQRRPRDPNSKEELELDENGKPIRPKEKPEECDKACQKKRKEKEEREEQERKEKEKKKKMAEAQVKFEEKKKELEKEVVKKVEIEVDETVIEELLDSVISVK